MHRKLGLLFAAKGDWDQALEHLAHDIFYASNEYGTDDIRTSGAYFDMATVFRHQDRMDIADDLYDRTTSIWYDHLHRLVQSICKPPDIPAGIGEVVAEITQEEKEKLENEAQEAEAIKVLNTIQEIRFRQKDIIPELRIRNLVALCMLYFILESPIKCREIVIMLDKITPICRDKTLIADAEWMKKNVGNDKTV